MIGVKVKTRVVLGIDPGATGALVLCDKNRRTLASIMPRSEEGVAELLRRWNNEFLIESCVLEKVWVMPDQGITSAATFMRGVGVLVGVLLSERIPFEEIRPQEWHKAIGIIPRFKTPKKPKPGIAYPPEESITEFKKRLMERAVEIFPRGALSLHNADAFLIAEVALRLRG
jgi:hypothetical protein